MKTYVVKDPRLNVSGSLWMRPARIWTPGHPHRDRSAGQAQADLHAEHGRGDFVIVINADKVTVTGNKMAEKMYYRFRDIPADCPRPA